MQNNEEINNSHQMWPDRPFIDNIWNSPQQLQPYYDFISKVRVVLEKAMKGEEKYVENGFEGWPTPSRLYCRTLDCIYLQVSNKGKHIDYLWTPFGEIRLLGSGESDAIEKISVAFMEEIKTICTLEDVTEEIELLDWNFGEICKTGNKISAGKLYRLIWNEHNVTCSNEIFVYVDPNIKYEREKEIFSILSNGTNKF